MFFVADVAMERFSGNRDGDGVIKGWVQSLFGRRVPAAPVAPFILAGLLGSLVGCLGSDLAYKAPSPPIISGVPTKVDTVGRPLTYTVSVTDTGGSIKSYSIAPAPPLGVTFDTLKGTISGTPLQTWAPTPHVITAKGFGGEDTAWIVLRVVQPKPNISYVTPVVDTQYRQSSHPVISTGGGDNVFSVSPALPSGLRLDTSTGLIWGSPLVPAPAVSYRVIARGPTGRDTAFIVLSVIENTSLPQNTTGVTVSANLGLASGIPLSKLVVAITSTAPGGFVTRDTILPGQNGFAASPTGAQSIGKFYPLAAGEAYVVSVKTLDAKDSVIHTGTDNIPLLANETVHATTLNLTSRFAAFTARIQLYANANQVFGTGDIPLTNRRAVFVSGSDTLYDTLAAGGSFPTTGNRLIGTPYVPANKVGQLDVLIFGTAPGWDSTKPFIRYLFTGPYVPGTTVYTPLGSYEGPAPE